VDKSLAARAHPPTVAGMTNEPRPVEIRFESDRDDSGWAPSPGEWLWAAALGRGRFRILNVPFYVPDICENDVVEADLNASGTWEFVRRIVWGGHVTVRLIFPAGGDFIAKVKAACKDLRSMGAHLGVMPGFVVVTVGMPPTAMVDAIKTYVTDGESKRRWRIEEVMVTEDWIAA
jgi:hypothetical protein